MYLTLVYISITLCLSLSLSIFAALYLSHSSHYLSHTSLYLCHNLSICVSLFPVHSLASIYISHTLCMFLSSLCLYLCFCLSHLLALRCSFFINPQNTHFHQLPFFDIISFLSLMFSLTFHFLTLKFAALSISFYYFSKDASTKV